MPDAGEGAPGASVADPLALVADVAARYRRCCWLDGGAHGGAPGWSLVGWLTEDDVSLSYDAATGEVRRHVGDAVTVVGDDPFTALEAELEHGSPADRWYGWFGYASRPDLPAARDPDDPVPTAVWMRPSRVRTVPHAAAGAGPGPLAEPDAAPGPVPDEYAEAFAAVQEALHRGDSYEVNLTLRRAIASGVPPLTAYARLRGHNPAPYAGFLQHDVPGARGWLLSSSPERYARVDGTRTLETKPIKGTTARGATPEEDARAAERLRSQQKFRAENLMITDLLRNDVGMVSRPGTVTVPSLMKVESYASVHQLVSTVRGRLRPDVSTVAALRALFPAGSMTGAPKRRTMEVIRDVEDTPRGVYAGAFGWVAGDGRADLGVVIRSLTTAGDGWYRLGTGGGITVLSDVAEEWAEAGWKAERLLAALG